jgi:hypothetical protein
VDGALASDAAARDVGATDSAIVDGARADAAQSDANAVDAAIGDGSPSDVGSSDAGPSSDGSMGPLKVSSSNSHFFVDPSGKAVLLAGSQTWTSFQDLSQSVPIAPINFEAYVSLLASHGNTATILWRKDLPTFCGWGAGGIWHATPFPWMRTGPGAATDGLLKFDLSMLDQSYFDRLRARVLLLRQSRIYAIVQLFDGLQLTGNRCTNDGYPLTGANNVNGIDDGYTAGSSGSASMTMTATNAITAVQDAYVKKVIDTLHDLDNVLWETSEEAPTASKDWWQGHIISLIHSYEQSTYGLSHPVGFPSTQYPGDDPALFASAADWVAPALAGASGIPIAPTNNQGKVIINDSDHSYYYTNFVDGSTGLVDTAKVRGFVWENFAAGASLLFMDPYVIDWTSGMRNDCAGAVGGVCGSEDTKYDDFRQNLGYAALLGKEMDLVAMTPQPGLSSTGYCLAKVSNASPEYMVYAPTGASFTVDLSGAPGSRTVEWIDLGASAQLPGAPVMGGAVVQFVPPDTSGVVLHIK